MEANTLTGPYSVHGRTVGVQREGAPASRHRAHGSTTIGPDGPLGPAGDARGRREGATRPSPLPVAMTVQRSLVQHPGHDRTTGTVSA